jgi:hypothetical protein
MSPSSATIVAELRRLAAICGGAKSNSEPAARKNLLSAFFRRQSASVKTKLAAATRQAEQEVKTIE